MSTREIDVNDIIRIGNSFRIGRVRQNVNVSTVSPYERYQLFIFLGVDTEVRLTIDGDSLRFLSPGIYLIGIRKENGVVNTVVYELADTSGDIAEGETGDPVNDCVNRCLFCAYYGGVSPGGIVFNVFINIATATMTIVPIIGASITCAAVCGNNTNAYRECF